MNAVSSQVSVVAKIRALAKSYTRSYRKQGHGAFRKDAAELISLLAKYKDEFVGVGRKGGWRRLVESLTLPLSFKSIDRAVEDWRDEQAEIIRKESEARTELILNRRGWRTEDSNVCYAGMDEAMM